MRQRSIVNPPRHRGDQPQSNTTTSTTTSSSLNQMPTIRRRCHVPSKMSSSEPNDPSSSLSNNGHKSSSSKGLSTTTNHSKRTVVSPLASTLSKILAFPTRAASRKQTSPPSSSATSTDQQEIRTATSTPLTIPAASNSNSNQNPVTVLNNKGVVYIQQREYAKAKQSLHQALLHMHKSEQQSPTTTRIMLNTILPRPYSPYFRGTSDLSTDSSSSSSLATLVSGGIDNPALASSSIVSMRARREAAARHAAYIRDHCSILDCDVPSNPRKSFSIWRGVLTQSGSASENSLEEDVLDSEDVGITSLPDMAVFEIGNIDENDDREEDHVFSLFCTKKHLADHPAETTDALSTSPCKTSWSYNKHRAEYDEGFDYFRAPVRLEDHSKNMDSVILFNLARVHHKEVSYGEALRIYKKALRALEFELLEQERAHHFASEQKSATRLCRPYVSSRDENLLALAILFGIGQIQYIKGSHVEALKTYTSAMGFAKGKFGPNSLEVAACMNCVGVLHYIMPDGSTEVALAHLKNCIRLRQQLLGEYHIDVGTTWNNVGRLYFQQGKYDRAMAAYRKSLKIRRAEQINSVDVAATIFNMGQVYHQKGDSESALRQYNDFLRLAKRHFGEYHRDICIVATCIGQVLHEKKDFRRAHKAFSNALRVGRVALGETHPEIAITLNKLGNLHYEAGDLDLALKAYNEGLEVELVVLDRGNPNICVTYTNIAEIYKQRMEFDKALENYEKVLELQREYGANPADIAHTLSTIGHVRYQKGDFQEAMDVNQECLRVRREHTGDIDEDVAATLTHIALVLIKLEMQDMALEVLSEAYRIRLKLNTTESRDIAFTLYNIALIYHHQGNYERALDFYLETSRVEKTALGGAHRDLSITYYNIGQIYYQRGDMELALENFCQALAIERECFGPNHPTCGRTLNEIGNIYLQRGHIKGLMQAFTEGLRIFRRVGIPDDHLVIYGKSLWRFECVHPEAAAAA